MQRQELYGTSPPAPPPNRAQPPRPPAYRAAHSASPPPPPANRAHPRTASSIQWLTAHHLRHLQHIQQTEITPHSLQHTEQHTAHTLQHLDSGVNISFRVLVLGRVIVERFDVDRDSEYF